MYMYTCTYIYTRIYIVYLYMCTCNLKVRKRVVQSFLCMSTFRVFLGKAP